MNATTSGGADESGSIEQENNTRMAAGNADTATTLATGRTIGMTGDVVWTSPSFDGSGNVTAAGTIQANAVQTGMVHDDVATELAGTGITAGSGVLAIGQAVGTIEAGTRRRDEISAPIHLAGGGPPIGLCSVRFGLIDPGYKCYLGYDQTVSGYFVSQTAGSKYKADKSNNQPYCLNESIILPQYTIKTQGKDEFGTPMPVFLVADFKNKYGS